MRTASNRNIAIGFVGHLRQCCFVFRNIKMNKCFTCILIASIIPVICFGCWGWEIIFKIFFLQGMNENCTQNSQKQVFTFKFSIKLKKRDCWEFFPIFNNIISANVLPDRINEKVCLFLYNDNTFLYLHVLIHQNSYIYPKNEDWARHVYHFFGLANTVIWICISTPLYHGLFAAIWICISTPLYHVLLFARRFFSFHYRPPLLIFPFSLSLSCFLLPLPPNIRRVDLRFFFLYFLRVKQRFFICPCVLVTPWK